MPRGQKDPNCPNCKGRSFGPLHQTVEDYMICRLCEEPESEFIAYYKERWPEAYAEWVVRNARNRLWADEERLPQEVILTWKEGAYYVSEPNFLEDGESVRLLVSAPPLHERLARESGANSRKAGIQLRQNPFSESQDDAAYEEWAQGWLAVEPRTVKCTCERLECECGTDRKDRGGP